MPIRDWQGEGQYFRLPGSGCESTVGQLQPGGSDLAADTDVVAALAECDLFGVGCCVRVVFFPDGRRADVLVGGVVALRFVLLLALWPRISVPM